MNSSLKERLESSFDRIVVDIPRNNQLTVTAPKESALSILSFLKNQGYDHLGLISCVDRIEEKAFELVYILHAYMAEDSEYDEKIGECVFVKARLPREKPAAVSAIPIFENAEPYERELHELFGVDFEGHPRLTPLLLEREYAIPPFRKDFDTREYVTETFDSIPFIEEEAGEQ